MTLVLRPYAFADFLAMKPGTLLGGFMHIQESWSLGPQWLLQAGDINPKRKNIYSLFPITEYKVKWRQRLREHSRNLSASRFYAPPLDAVEACWKNPKNTIKIGFDLTKPVGIYLGHFLRCNGVSLVNVLTPEGYDVWI